ncbi:MFS transporter [Pedococcus sp. 5OH_020]|uniref:MFS transporter n=1 Tax=Pedococcus sp. 5OH_020 TaxID=2989814 RepID=UPI0022E9F202|nr:MFS transporter [Pedococcus sp. 5OH_020]
MRRYLQILRRGHAGRPFAASVLARLPISMAPLGIVLLVSEVQGAYGYAGAVAGAFAVGTAVGGPWWAARIDRTGQTRVILATSVSSAIMLVGVSLSAVSNAPPAMLMTTAAAAGATFPPLGPGMRATWARALDDPDLSGAAFALDAVAVESIFVGGPLLLSGLLILTPPMVPLLVTAALLGAGGTAYSLAEAVRHQRPRTVLPANVGDARRPLVWRTAGVPGVLAVTAAVSVGFGHIDTSMAAISREILHDPSRIGLLFTAIAGGSVTGGLVYGGLRPSSSEHHRLPFLLGVMAVGLAPLPLIFAFSRPRLWWLMCLLFVAGLSIAPSLIISQNLIDRLTSQNQASEAQAWLSTAGTTGAAAGTAVAGVLIDRLGLQWSFAAAAAAVLVGSLLCTLHRDRWTLHHSHQAASGGDS